MLPAAPDAEALARRAMNTTAAVSEPSSSSARLFSPLFDTPGSQVGLYKNASGLQMSIFAFPDPLDAHFPAAAA